MSTQKRTDQSGREAPSSGGEPSRPEGAPAGERLQKVLARAGVASRRHAEALIAAGRVTVNGEPVRQLGTRVDPERDEIRVDGRALERAAPLTYVLLHKPAGTITTASDPQGRVTVLDLLPEALRARRIYPVGRLDRDTEGLLLLTNDGALTLRLAHPRYALPKEYQALVRDVPTAAALERLRQGVMLAGDPRPTAPARVWVARHADGGCWLGLELHEGRNRQVRRMLEAVGHDVRALRRVRIGPLRLGHMPPGAWRELRQSEVAALRQAVGLADGVEHG